MPYLISFIFDFEECFFILILSGALETLIFSSCGDGDTCVIQNSITQNRSAGAWWNRHFFRQLSITRRNLFARREINRRHECIKVGSHIRHELVLFPLIVANHILERRSKVWVFRDAVEQIFNHDHQFRSRDDVTIVEVQAPQKLNIQSLGSPTLDLLKQLQFLLRIWWERQWARFANCLIWRSTSCGTRCRTATTWRLCESLFFGKLANLNRHVNHHDEMKPCTYIGDRWKHETFTFSVARFFRVLVVFFGGHAPLSGGKK